MLVPVIVSFACSKPSGSTQAAITQEADGGEDVLAPPPIVRSQGEATLAPLREACHFEAGAWPAQTIGKEYPLGTDIPIDHVVVIMQENRSFDHYLGRLVAQGYYAAGDFTADGGADGGRGPGFSSSTALDAPPPGWSNSDADGGIVTPHADD
ncbi:MAG TPA: alkaline phosphatase family protein, partial [Polyangiaceae bacterium]|nr:alkaline phosphatase family protein [Polyangiaceae bacterium]